MGFNSGFKGLTTADNIMQMTEVKNSETIIPVEI